MKIEIGQKLKCVNEGASLTVGNYYEVIRISQFKVTVKADNDIKYSHPLDKFEIPGSEVIVDGKTTVHLVSHGMDYSLIGKVENGDIPHIGQMIRWGNASYEVKAVHLEYTEEGTCVVVGLAIIKNQSRIDKLLSNIN